MIAEFNNNITQRVPGVEVIIGDAPDYIELTFAHRELTGESLLLGEFGGYNTRTNTSVEGGNVMSVGGIDSHGNMDLSWGSPNERGNMLVVTPLVIPAVTK